MPQYTYHCKECEANFSIYAAMNDDKNNVYCESCASNNVYRVYSRILAKTSGFTKDNSAPVVASSAKSSSGCGTCSSHGCGTCH